MRQLAEQRGWSVIQVYSDRMSGAKEDRPGLKALMQDARRAPPAELGSDLSCD